MQMNQVMGSEHERVRGVLIDTISLLCKSSLTYATQLKIEGVIGITVDGCIFLVHMDQQFGPNDADEINQSHFARAGFHIKNEPIGTSDDLSEFPQGGPSKQKGGQQKMPTNPNVRIKLEQGQTNHESQNSFSASVLRKKPRQQKTPPQSNRPGESEGGAISLDDYDEEQFAGMQENFNDITSDPSYEIQGEEMCGDWPYEAQRKPARTRARGTRHQSGPRRNTSYHPDGTSLVITESSHICGYPGCFKRFKFRHDLLRHQTKKHGRKPAFTRARASNSTPTNSEDYYYVDDDGDFVTGNDGEGDYDYGYQ